MLTSQAWLLDVFEDLQTPGLILWFLTSHGERLRLRQPFPVVFYLSGKAHELREAWKFLKEDPARPTLSRQSKKDIFLAKQIDVLAVQLHAPGDLPRVFKRVSERFPQLSYYDTDIKLPIRHAAAYNTFPLCFCSLVYDENGFLETLTVQNSPWDLDPVLPALRLIELEPDCDPFRAEPRFLVVKTPEKQYRLSLFQKRPLLIILQALLKKHDPDLLLTRWGDTWLIPWLLAAAQQLQLPLCLNREINRPPVQRPERSYFSYGQIVYSGQQVHLWGRWHIDRQNALFWRDFGVDGILETARVTAQPVQQAARCSPGTGISTMQLLTALRSNILVPWHKQQAEQPKSALDLLQADLGGLIYQPRLGLHRDVGAIDFISMYPAIMVRCNISPETGKPGLLESSSQPPGLIPQTLAPLLEKRVNLKQRLACRPGWHPGRKLDTARASAHKWLLVTCFGYLGYKNARFGRIEAHEAVTASGREAVLRAKEAAEEAGFEVLHLYVDGLWVQQPGKNRPEDFRELLSAIADRTGLSIALDGVYRWVVFLPSRADERVPVPNRYFGVFQDGSLKVRGLEARRRDTAAWVAQLQMALLEYLALAEDAADLPAYLPGAVAILRQQLSDLRQGRVPLEDLLIAFRITRPPEDYKVKTAAARAAQQLAAIGKVIRPGQRVRLLYLRGGRVHAWDLPQPPNPAAIDRARYQELALRAAASVFYALGVNEQTLRSWMQGGIQLTSLLEGLSLPTL